MRSAPSNCSPKGWYDKADLAQAAESFSNLDWVAIMLHGYCSRRLPKPVDHRYDRLAEIIDYTTSLRTPTLMIQGQEDAYDPLADSSKDAAWFKGPYERLVLPGISHFP